AWPAFLYLESRRGSPGHLARTRPARLAGHPARPELGGPCVKWLFLTRRPLWAASSFLALVRIHGRCHPGFPDCAARPYRYINIAIQVVLSNSDINVKYRCGQATTQTTRCGSPW